MEKREILPVLQRNPLSPKTTISKISKDKRFSLRLILFFSL